MTIEQTLVLIKPDGLVKSLTGNILSRLSETKLIIIGARVVKVYGTLAKEHYKHLSDKPFFEELVEYIMGDVHNTHRVMALIYQGEDAITKVRDIVGRHQSREGEPGFHPGRLRKDHHHRSIRERGARLIQPRGRGA